MTNKKAKKMPRHKGRKLIERRFFPAEFRVKKSGKIVGYPAEFNKLSQDLGGFREFIRPGAFQKTIEENDIRALFNHNPDYVLGRNTAGTLDLKEDDRGLYMEADPPDTQWANDLRVSLERKDIDQGSFGFDTIRDEWTTVDGEQQRELVETKLFDVSVVTFPAYEDTHVSARSVFESFVTLIAPFIDSDDLAEMRELIKRFDATVAPGTGPHPTGPEGQAGTGSHMVHRRRKLEILRR